MLETSIISYLGIAGLLAHGAAATAFSWFPKIPKVWSARISGLSLSFFMLAILGAMFRSTMASRPVVGFPVFMPFAADNLALAFSALVAFLAVIVFKFSNHYLDGNSAEKRFYVWGHTTIFGVLCMALAVNLGFFLLSWLLVSYGLHKLLTLHPGRKAAQTAAWAKFWVSRIGDLSLFAGAALIFAEIKSLDFVAIKIFAESMGSSQAAGLHWSMNGAALLITMGAMIKSAQVPFHFWLPEALETPAPVSALMHAGVINGGGYLLIRMFDFVNMSTWSIQAMAAIGTVSIVICSLSLMATPDFKRQMAFSTSAQLGFMFCQIAIGVPAAALAHMIGHALYKAHAFLSSGGLPLNLPSTRREIPIGKLVKWRAMGSMLLLAILGIAPIIVWAFSTLAPNLATILSLNPIRNIVSVAIIGIALISTLQLTNLFKRKEILAGTWQLAGIVLGAVFMMIFVTSGSEWIVAETGRVNTAQLGVFWASLMTSGIAFVAAAPDLFKFLPPRIRLIVFTHARSGFYFWNLAANLKLRQP